MFGVLFWLFVIGIVYTYAGYPLLLAMLARLRPKPKPYPPAFPSVTLLIAAYNEQAVIKDKIENSLNLDYPRGQLQILIAADGSTDNTADIVRSFNQQGVGLSYSPERRGKMAAINRAMPLARGEIVVFSDANNLYAPDALSELVKPFADPTVGASSGAKVIIRSDEALGESEGIYWKYESFIKKQETRLGCCTGVAGEILALRRNLFIPPPDTIINDDFYMAMQVIRQGYRVVYVPTAISNEPPSLSAQDEITRRSRIIAGRYQAIARAFEWLPLRRPLVIWQIVSHKFLRPMVPLAMAGALIANILGVVFPAQASHLWGKLIFLAPPIGWIMLGLQAVFYGLAWIGRYISRGSLVGRLLYLPTFLVNSNLAAVIGLYRYLTGRQSAVWQRVRRREAGQP
jgi:cellulose synthase/poly-beta-1,6-N-acetylglucosamine synthase-like glycosyltransferase